MSLRTTIRPLSRVPRQVCVTIPSRRYLNLETDPKLYSATAVSSGGRKGHVKGSDGLKLILDVPKSLGGTPEDGKTTNPEELFAAGLGSCFQSTMGLCASDLGLDFSEKPEDNVVETKVTMAGGIKKRDLGVQVKMLVRTRGLKQRELERLVEETRKVCPFSRFIDGNMTLDIKVEVM